MQAVTESGATRVIDLGCGEGKLLKELLKQKQIQEIAGMDVSHRSLEIASERMHFDTMPPKQKERIRLFQGSLMYKDGRLAGFETATAIEVIEHLDPPRLAAFERVVFEHAKPNTVIITTPNSRIQRAFRNAACGPIPAQGSPLRVDVGSSFSPGRRSCAAFRVHRDISASGQRGCRSRIARHRWECSHGEDHDS